MVLTAILVGAIAQLAQVATIREILAVAGGSDLVIGLMLGAWLGWAALGTVAATRLRPGGLGVVLACCPLALLVQGIAIRLVDWGAGNPTGQILSLDRLCLLCGLAPAPTAWATGLAFGWLLALRPEEAGRTCRAEALGAVVGGLCATALVAPRLGSLWAFVTATGLAAYLGTWKTPRDTAQPSRNQKVQLSAWLGCWTLASGG